jgi:hypothetical protein
VRAAAEAKQRGPSSDDHRENPGLSPTPRRGGATSTSRPTGKRADTHPTGRPSDEPPTGEQRIQRVTQSERAITTPMRGRAENTSDRQASYAATVTGQRVTTRVVPRGVCDSYRYRSTSLPTGSTSSTSHDTDFFTTHDSNSTAAEGTSELCRRARLRPSNSRPDRRAELRTPDRQASDKTRQAGRALLQQGLDFPRRPAAAVRPVASSTPAAARSLAWKTTR